MKSILKTVLITGAFAGLAATAASAQMALPENLALSSTSKIWFDGTSNVKSFSCAAKKLDLDIVSNADLAPAKIVKSASLSMPVSQLDCKNGKMNEHMRDALKAEKNPAITWKLS